MAEIDGSKERFSPEGQQDEGHGFNSEGETASPVENVWEIHASEPPKYDTDKLLIAALSKHSKTKVRTVLFFIALGLVGVGLVLALSMDDEDPKGAAAENDPIVVGQPEDSDQNEIPIEKAELPMGDSPKRTESSGQGSLRKKKAQRIVKPSVSQSTKRKASDYALSQSSKRSTADNKREPEPGMELKASYSSESTGTSTAAAESGESAQSVRAAERSYYGMSVRNTIRKWYASRVQSCFANAAKNDPNLSGVVILRLSIAGTGRVEKASVSRNTTGNDRLGKCLAAQSKTWTMPEPPHNQPIVFSVPFSR